MEAGPNHETIGETTLWTRTALFGRGPAAKTSRKARAPRRHKSNKESGQKKDKIDAYRRICATWGRIARVYWHKDTEASEPTTKGRRQAQGKGKRRGARAGGLVGSEWIKCNFDRVCSVGRAAQGGEVRAGRQRHSTRAGAHAQPLRQGKVGRAARDPCPTDGRSRAEGRNVGVRGRFAARPMGKHADRVECARRVPAARGQHLCRGCVVLTSIADVYSTPGFTNLAVAFGLQPGSCADLEAINDNGEGWDLMCTAQVCPWYYIGTIQALCWYCTVVMPHWYSSLRC